MLWEAGGTLPLLQVGLMLLADLITPGRGPGKNWKVRPAWEPVERPAWTGSSPAFCGSRPAHTVSSSPAFSGSRACAAFPISSGAQRVLCHPETGPRHTHTSVCGTTLAAPSLELHAVWRGGRVGTHAPL